MTQLSVNVNKIAWLRNARGGLRPDIVDCCRIIVEAGAHGLTVHPRPDQRHITPEDVVKVGQCSRCLSVEFNIEGNPAAGARANGYPGFFELVEQARPDQCTLVPDSDQQLTSDHGFDLENKETFEQVRSDVARFSALGTRVSLFLDPSLSLVDLAKATGTDRIELYTGPWVDAVLEHGIDSESAEQLLDSYRQAANHAHSIGLGVNAGHDLNLSNLAKFVAIGPIAEVSIGHALISDALEFGLEETVKRYLACLPQAK